MIYFEKDNLEESTMNVCIFTNSKARKYCEEDPIHRKMLPSKTDQEWFHKIKHLPIIWIRGRLKFKNNKYSATQPHFLVKIN